MARGENVVGLDHPNGDSNVMLKQDAAARQFRFVKGGLVWSTMARLFANAACDAK